MRSGRLGLDRARAVVVVDDGFDLAALRAMGARGACGVRFNAVSRQRHARSNSSRRWARSLAQLGWHLQLYAHAAEMVALEPVLARLPVPVVIDHMGGVKAAEGGLEIPASRRCCGCWKKADVPSGPSSAATARPPPASPMPMSAGMARAMIAAAPDRCVWGTDWPHPSLNSPDEVPDDGATDGPAGRLGTADGQRRAILVDNPARLYGF